MSKKLQMLCSSGHPIFAQVSPACGKNVLATATPETRKCLIVRFSVKSWCSNQIFYVTVANAEIGSVKYHL